MTRCCTSATRGVDGAAGRREPQAVVHEVGVHRGEAGLDAIEIPRNDQALQLAVGGVQDDGGGGLVDLPRLDAHEPVLAHVDAPDAVGAGDGLEARDELDEGHRHPVDRGRHAPLEVEAHVGGRIGRTGRRLRQRVDLFGRLGPGVFQHPALDGLAPQVEVGAVGAVDGGGHGNAALPGVLDLGGARHAPLAGRPDDPDGPVQRPRRHVYPDLVVALAGAPVGDRRRRLHLRDLDEALRDQGTAERRGQRVLPFVERPPPAGRGGRTRRRTRCGHRGRDSGWRPPPSRARGRRRAPSPARGPGSRPRLRVVLLGQPGNRDRRVEAARIREYHTLHLLLFSLCLWTPPARGPLPPTRLARPVAPDSPIVA